MLVTLQDLGNNQVNKAIVMGHNIEAYHINKCRDADATCLRDRLLNMTNYEMEHTTIMLYISPCALSRTTKDSKLSGWVELTAELVKKDRISLFCINEHAVQQNGRVFWHEFVEAMNKIKHFIDASPIFIPVIAMPATTLYEIDKDTICELLGVDVPTIIHSHLDCRGTTF